MAVLLRRADGSLWIGDVGQGAVGGGRPPRPRSRRGLNLGWSCYEGLEKFEGRRLRGRRDVHRAGLHVLTVHRRLLGHRRPVYRGQEYADLVGGTYIATDYCSSTVWALRPDGAGGYEQAEIGEMPTQVTSIGATADGEFYVVNDLPGGLHRVSFDRSRTHLPGGPRP